MVDTVRRPTAVRLPPAGSPLDIAEAKLLRPPRRRGTVDRPALVGRLIDSPTTPIIAIVAPAGYGKTTLAEQWVARDGRSAAWYTARSSATDVAALALGLARCATTVVEGCDHRLREHLRALPAPGENVETLAEIVAEEIPGAFVTSSADIFPQFREFERFTTACMNAFVGPSTGSYLERLAGALADEGVPGKLHVMMSNGGVASRSSVESTSTPSHRATS